MSKTNNHDGENWPYHPYEGSKPELQGSYVPCATNPCSMHGSSDVMATSSEDAYTKAHQNDSFGMSASSTTTNNNDNSDNNKLDYNGYTVSVNDFAKSLIKTDYNISCLSDMAETLEVVAPNDDILTKYNFAHYADYEGKNKVNEIIDEDPYTPLFRDPITGESELYYGDVDWDGTGDGVRIYTPYAIEPGDDKVIIWNNYSQLEIVSKKSIEKDTWERRASIIDDYMNYIGNYDDEGMSGINKLDAKINENFSSPEKTSPAYKFTLEGISNSFNQMKKEDSKSFYNCIINDGGLEVIDNNSNSHHYYFSKDDKGRITGFSDELGKQPTYKFDKPIDYDFNPYNPNKDKSYDTVRDAILADINNK